VPGLVGSQVDTQREKLLRRFSPGAVGGSPSLYRCLSD
jgi:hypothetical protein